MDDGRPHDIGDTAGGGGKWLLGAIAAAVLLGGGYWAWTNFSPSGNGAQSAYDEPVQDIAPPPEPLEQYAATDDATPLENEPSAEAVAVTPAPRASAPTRRRAPAQQIAAAEVPEETIGVTPDSVTTETNSDEIVVTAPRRSIWTRTPSARRLSALYPARALERGREGEARLHCTVLASGALDCVRAEETRGEFGMAALRVARTLRHAPTLADGSDAAGSPVNLRVVFRMEDDARRG